jgi:subtilase family serine protease
MKTISAVLIAAGSLLYFPSVCVARSSPAAAPRIVEPVDETKLVQLEGSPHPLARPEYDEGTVPDDLGMDHMLFLLRRTAEQEKALQRLMDDLYDSHSANYHQWLTPQQFGSDFGPSERDVATVTSWLRSHAFRVNFVYPSGTLLDISGTAGALRAAFHTTIHRYNVNGVRHIANANSLHIPAALAPVVVGFASLNDFRPEPLIRNVTSVKKDRATGRWTPVGPQPAYSFTNSLGSFEDVGPLDFGTIYNVTPLWTAGNPITGAGQTIVVVESSEINKADWDTFRSALGLSSFAGTLSQVNPSPPSGPSNCTDPGTVANPTQLEAAVDSEWAGAAAPDAAIELAACADTMTTPGFDLAAANLIQGANPPPIISLSFVTCESDLGADGSAFVNDLWQQAAVEGISVMVAAGDSGATCAYVNAPAMHGKAVNGYASTPYNLAVGGTDFSDYVDGTVGSYWNMTNSPGGESAKSYIPETPWNDSCASSVLYTAFGLASEEIGSGAAFCNTLTAIDLGLVGIAGGGGGPSSVYAKPSWQSGVTGIVNDGARDLPDVAFFGADGFGNEIFNNTHALLFCMSDASAGGQPCSDVTANQAGGTSFAAPAFAGIQALINQKKGARQGNPGPLLYGLAMADYAGIFHDVTRGDNDVVCAPGSTADCYAPAGYSYGVLSTSTAGVAYPATIGWDFASGLGSVDVTSLVNAAGATSTTTTSTTSSTTTTLQCGDVNGDHTLNIGDALAIAQFLVGQQMCGTGQFTHPELCDVGDPVGCDIGDALRIAQCNVGLIGCAFTCTPFACQ